MATFTTIPDSDLDADSPITENLMLALRDNPLAIAQGDASAPKIQRSGINDIPYDSAGQNELRKTFSTGGTVVASNGTLGTTVYTSIPSGWYLFGLSASGQDTSSHTYGLQVNVNGSWITANTFTGDDNAGFGGGLIVSDGSKVRIFATCETSSKLAVTTFTYTKLA